ncbi:MAG: diguanylate cyclase [Desulfuromonadaceae bacterium]
MMERPCILIIDDDPNLRKTLADILRIKGYETLTAADGEKGLAVLLENRVNLVLLDLGLPGIPGLEVLARIKAGFPLIEAIVLTGQATIDSAVEATNRGAFSYLVKPYEIDQLINYVRRALEKQQSEEEIARYHIELENMNAELKTLHEVSKAISQTLDMDELVNEVLQALVRTKIFPFELRGGIFLVDDGKIRLASFENLPETLLKPCQEISLGQCLCGQAVATGEIVVYSVTGGNELPAPCHPEKERYGRIIVPLKVVNTVVGLLSLYTEPETEVSENLLNLLASLGSQIGIALNNAKLYEQTKISSLHDPLTGLANRRFLQLQLEKSFEAAKRYQEKLSVVMLDIDHFKNYNDTRGHLEGDRLLAKFAELLVKELRDADFVFRYGGEEFLFMLPETDLAMACEVAERVRMAVQAETDVTISLGVASFTDDMSDKESLVRKADEALFRAKRNGRNRVERSVE